MSTNNELHFGTNIFRAKKKILYTHKVFLRQSVGRPIGCFNWFSVKKKKQSQWITPKQFVCAHNVQVHISICIKSLGIWCRWNRRRKRFKMKKTPRTTVYFWRILVAFIIQSFTFTHIHIHNSFNSGLLAIRIIIGMNGESGRLEHTIIKTALIWYLVSFQQNTCFFSALLFIFRNLFRVCCF